MEQVKLFATLESGVIIRLPLLSAIHSEYSNVLLKLLRSDDTKTEIDADEAIILKFLALPPKLKPINFIFEIEGNNPYLK